MTELDLLIDLHRANARQGPGSPASTLRAFQLTGLDPQKPLRVVDIGCGTGAATLTLAGHSQGHFTAVDFSAVLLQVLAQRAQAEGLAGRIETRKAMMEALPFAPESFDLIWSEGAIYNMGFENGLRAWLPFLKPGGVLAVSEISWLTGERPAEIEAYWQTHYPEIATVSRKVETLEACGFENLGHFTLPPSDWLDHYYGPLGASLEAFVARHPEHQVATAAIVAQEREEIELYERYQAYFSYGFYVGRRKE